MIYFFAIATGFKRWFFSTDTKDYIKLLPDELLIKIFSNFDTIQDLLNLTLVNKQFNPILKDEALFKVIFLKQFPFLERSLPRNHIQNWIKGNWPKISAKKNLVRGKFHDWNIRFSSALLRQPLHYDPIIFENHIALLYGTSNQSVIVWEISTHKTVFHRQISQTKIHSNHLEISSDLIIVWTPQKLENKCLIHIYKMHTKGIFKNYEIDYTFHGFTLQMNRLFYLDLKKQLHQINLATDKKKCLIPNFQTDFLIFIDKSIFCAISIKGCIKYWDIENEKIISETQLKLEKTEDVTTVSTSEGYVFIQTTKNHVFTIPPESKKSLIAEYRSNQLWAIIHFSSHWLVAQAKDGSFILEDLRLPLKNNIWWPILHEKSLWSHAIVDFPYLFTKEPEGPITIYNIETNEIVATYDNFGQKSYFYWKHGNLIGQSKDKTIATILDFSNPSSKK